MILLIMGNLIVMERKMATASLYRTRVITFLGFSEIICLMGKVGWFSIMEMFLSEVLRVTSLSEKQKSFI